MFESELTVAEMCGAEITFQHCLNVFGVDRPPQRQGQFEQLCRLLELALPDQQQATVVKFEDAQWSVAELLGQSARTVEVCLRLVPPAQIDRRFPAVWQKMCFPDAVTDSVRGGDPGAVGVEPFRQAAEGAREAAGMSERNGAVVEPGASGMLEHG